MKLILFHYSDGKFHPSKTAAISTAGLKEVTVVRELDELQIGEAADLDFNLKPETTGSEVSAARFHHISWIPDTPVHWCLSLWEMKSIHLGVSVCTAWCFNPQGVYYEY